METNKRLCSVKEYHFKTIDDIKKKLISQGKIITDLGIGDPDLGLHEEIISGLIKGLGYKEFNKYPPYDGIVELKKGIIEYYKKVYAIDLELDEVIILIGSKEGISNLIPAICNIGDYVISPDPRYPVYEMCSYLWGNKVYKVPIEEKNNYLVDLRKIPDGIREKAKLMIINYPNNPTGAVANKEFYKEIINYCSNNEISLCNDGAYNEIIKEDEEPISILQLGKNKKVIEFGSFSKTYNMTGFRIGYAVGNREIIKALLKVKSNIDSSQFKPIQYAALSALKLDRSYIYGIRKIYDERRETVKKVLREKGIKYFEESRAFYLWCNVPNGYKTDDFCQELLSEYGIIITPGYSFGELGHGYFRIALTQDKKIMHDALNKLKVYN